MNQQHQHDESDVTFAWHHGSRPGHTRLSNIKSYIALVAALGYATSIASCSSPQPPTLSPEKSEITSITNRGIELDVTLSAHNPNRFSLTANSVNATITLGQKITLPLHTTTNNIRLPPKQTTAVVIKLQATWQQTMQLAQLVLSGPQIPYSIQGTVQLGGKVISANLPFTMYGNINQAELIGAGIKGLQEQWQLPK